MVLSSVDDLLVLLTEFSRLQPLFDDPVAVFQDEVNAVGVEFEQGSFGVPGTDIEDEDLYQAGRLNFSMLDNIRFWYPLSCCSWLSGTLKSRITRTI